MGYYTGYSGFINESDTNGPGVYSDPKRAKIPTPGAAFEVSFYSSAVPTGMVFVQDSLASYNSSYSLSTGLTTYGDASTVFVYQDQVNQSFTGDILIQTSFQYIGTDNCPDPSIAIWPVANGRTYPVWAWGISPTRIAAQNNCATATQIYGRTLTVGGGSFIYTTNSWYTMHFSHLPSLGQCKYYMTLGQNDWASTGNAVGTAAPGIVLSESYGETEEIYVGLSSDADGGISQACIYSGIKVTPL